MLPSNPSNPLFVFRLHRGMSLTRRVVMADPKWKTWSFTDGHLTNVTWPAGFGREKRHLGVIGRMKSSFYGNPHIRVVFFQKSLSESLYLEISIWEILIYIYRERERFIYTNKPTSVMECDICFVLWFFMAQFFRLKSDSVKRWHWNIPADGLKTDSVNFSECWILPLSRN